MLHLKWLNPAAAPKQQASRIADCSSSSLTALCVHPSAHSSGMSQTYSQKVIDATLTNEYKDNFFRISLYFVETELLLCLKIFISMEISAKLTMISHLKSQAKQAVVEGASTE